MIEKEMVNDALNNMNSALTSYASAIAQTENTELRSTLIQMRNQAEKSQYDLYTIAKNLNYYTPAQQASQEEITKVKSEVCQNCATASSSSNMNASSQSQGLLNNVDEQTKQALQAPPKTNTDSYR